MYRAALTVAALASLVLACSSSAKADAPDSPDVLNAHGKLQYACSFVVTSSPGVPPALPNECDDGKRCDEVQAINIGPAYQITDPLTFLGTCAKPGAVISADSMQIGCDIAPALCLKDPDCLALRDCAFTYCKADDDACVDTCFKNSDQGAETDNLFTSMQCVADGWTNDDLTALFAPAASN